MQSVESLNEFDWFCHELSVTLFDKVSRLFLNRRFLCKQLVVAQVGHHFGFGMHLCDGRRQLVFLEHDRRLDQVPLVNSILASTLTRFDSHWRSGTAGIMLKGKVGIQVDG